MEQRAGMTETDEALETLRLLWGDAYEISRSGDGWAAVSRDDEGRVFTAVTPGTLEATLRADWGREGTL